MLKTFMPTLAWETKSPRHLRMNLRRGRQTGIFAIAHVCAKRAISIFMITILRTLYDGRVDIII